MILQNSQTTSHSHPTAATAHQIQDLFFLLFKHILSQQKLLQLTILYSYLL